MLYDVLIKIQQWFWQYNRQEEDWRLRACRRLPVSTLGKVQATWKGGLQK